jgi:hypothetical protein
MTSAKSHWDVFRKNGEKYALLRKIRENRKVTRRKIGNPSVTSLKKISPKSRKVNNDFVVRVSGVNTR